jgi:hypothetical protein
LFPPQRNEKKSHVYLLYTSLCVLLQQYLILANVPRENNTQQQHQKNNPGDLNAFPTSVVSNSY